LKTIDAFQSKLKCRELFDNILQLLKNETLYRLQKA